MPSQSLLWPFVDIRIYTIYMRIIGQKQIIIENDLSH